MPIDLFVDHASMVVGAQVVGSSHRTVFDTTPAVCFKRVKPPCGDILGQLCVWGERQGYKCTGRAIVLVKVEMESSAVHTSSASSNVLHAEVW